LNEYFVCVYECSGGVTWYPDKQELEELSGPVLTPDVKMWRWQNENWNRKFWLC